MRLRWLNIGTFNILSVREWALISWTDFLKYFVDGIINLCISQANNSGSFTYVYTFINLANEFMLAPIYCLANISVHSK